MGLAQRVSGVTGTGSIVVINSDITGGVWTDNNTLNINDVVFFDNQVAGKVFAVGNVVVGSVSGASGRVLSIIDDGDSTGKLVLANRSGGAFNDAAPDLLQVKSVTIAEVENTTAILAASVINIPNGVRTEQRIAQGGIYASTESLNIVRSSNALYTFLQDTFDELGHTI